MIWVGLLLVGLGLADLLHGALRTTRARRVVPEAIAGVTAIAVGLASGLHARIDLVLLLAVGLVVLAWGWLVRRGFGTRSPVPALVLLGLAVATALGLSALSSSSGGLLGDWLEATSFAPLHQLDADRCVLLLGAALVQGSTGNVLVRLVLLATHTVRPGAAEAADPGPRLKGGRLLGPMERLIILGLGLTGAFTAIGIVVAAKGLLRFPELQAAREATEGPSITDVTEYFLVGSFVSWTFSLATLALVAV